MIKLSSLNKTWILDLDGTLVKHNGYLLDGKDTLLEGTKKFLNNIDKNDLIIIVTSRKSKYKKMTIDFLAENKIRYDKIIFNAPYGERILINDEKPSGLKMSYALSVKRDEFDVEKIVIDDSL